MNRRKRIFQMVLYLLVAALAVFGGCYVTGERSSLWISLCAAVLACVPYFLRFERKSGDGGRLMLLAVLTALSVLGRFAFSFVPFFKPVTAIVILTGVYLGRESGFLCGAMSALLSGFLFGQGPWTPFQMVAWGGIGLLGALLAAPLKKHRIALLTFGAVAGVLYSFVMDILTVLMADGSFQLQRYFVLLVAALPVTAVYVASDVIFLLLLGKTVGEKLERVQIRYGWDR